MLEKNMMFLKKLKLLQQLQEHLLLLQLQLQLQLLPEFSSKNNIFFLRTYPFKKRGVGSYYVAGLLVT